MATRSTSCILSADVSAQALNISFIHKNRGKEQQFTCTCKVYVISLALLVLLEHHN